MPESFEQQPRESNKAFAAFSLYLSLGVNRSTRLVGKQLGKSEGLIERWSAKYGWTARVAAHGAYLAVVEREATEALARGKSAEWLTKSQKHRDEEWDMRTELIAAGRAVLAKFKDGARNATLGDAARALEVASKLGRLACGMPTDHTETEITGDDGGPVRIELTAALDRIYGPSTIVDIEPVTPALPEAAK